MHHVRAMMSAFLLLALFSDCLLAVVAMPLEGSTECPCVNHTDSSYGRGCRAHDINGSRYPQCLSAEPPKWCDDHWCYVDRSNCDVTNEISASEGAEKYWSYTTCGYRDLFLECTSHAFSMHVLLQSFTSWY